MTGVQVISNLLPDLPVVRVKSGGWWNLCVALIFLIFRGCHSIALVGR